MGITNLYKNFFGDQYRGLANSYNTYVKHSASVGGDGGLGGLACRVIWCLNFTSYEYTPSNLTNGNANNAANNNNGVYLDNVSKINRWITESNMFKHMEGLCCKVDMPNFSITQQVDNTKGKVTIDNREGVYQTVGGSPIWGDKDTIKLTFYETQIPLIENYIWPWLKTCKYSFVSTRDIFSIPRANMHILLYPDDIQTNVAFKYIVYGMYPVSFDSYQPTHEKKSAIDRRGVTFAYNNITVEQDTTFVNGLVDNWGKQPAGNSYMAVSNTGTAGKLGSKLNNDNEDDIDTTKKINQTKITNTADPDNEKELKKNIFNAIKLNGKLDGSNSGNFDTPSLLNFPNINGYDSSKEYDLHNKLNGLNGDADNQANGENGKNNNQLNGGNDKLIDTTELIKPPTLQITDNYLQNYGKKPTQSNNLNGGGLSEQISKLDNNLSSDSDSGKVNGNYLKSVNDASQIHGADNQGGENGVGSNNRINQLLGILNQISDHNNNTNANGNHSDGLSDGKNTSGLKSVNDASQAYKAGYLNGVDGSGGQYNNGGVNQQSDVNTRTYSVVKQKDDVESGWGNSNEKSIGDVIISAEIQKQIERKSVEKNSKTLTETDKNASVIKVIQAQQNETNYMNDLSSISSDLNQTIFSKNNIMSIDDALTQDNVDQRSVFGEQSGVDEQRKFEQSGVGVIKSTQLSDDVVNKQYNQVAGYNKNVVDDNVHKENVINQSKVVIAANEDIASSKEVKVKNVAAEMLKKLNDIIPTNDNTSSKNNVNQIIGVISKQKSTEGVAINNVLENTLVDSVKSFNSVDLTNDETDRKMASIDKSISLDDAISMFEEQSNNDFENGFNK